MEAWVFTAILALLSAASPAVAQERSGAVPDSASSIDSAEADSNSSDDAGRALASAATESNSSDAIRRLPIRVGQSRPISFPGFVKTIRIDNPAKVEAVPNKKNLAEVVITGIEPGVAEIVIIDRSGNEHLLEVTVAQDSTPLQLQLNAMFPDANIQVVPGANETALLMGYLENPQDVEQIVKFAESYYPGGVINRLQVVGPQQVQVRVMIAEVSRTKLRALGFNFLSADPGDHFFASTVGGLLTIDTVDPDITFRFSDDNNFVFGKVDGGDIFRGFLRALKTEGLAKIYTDTTLTAFNGRAAKLNDGGEFPILVPDQQGKVTVDFREFGNKLDFVAILLGNGRIRLEVRPELSELDKANGVELQGFFIPAIKTRYLETSVELNTGETFVVGGLLRTGVNSTTNKVPYLGDLAIIGAAFRTVSYNQEEKEFVIMLTPELVEPLKAGQKPCSFPGSESTHPSNHELFLLGNVEVPSCDPCELGRRSALMMDGTHTRALMSRLGLGPESQKGKVPGSSDPGTPPQQQPTAAAAQRSTQPTGLIGPLGYDGGR
jgi:pilus assembly protein CpaC